MGEGSADGGKAAKTVLFAFAALSIGAVIYKIAAAPLSAPGAPVETQAAVSAEKAVVKAPVAQQKANPGKRVGTKTAVVYYFYTNARCSSCKTIEAYTREAVEKNFASGYKDWAVVFKGVNLDEGANAHFKQDYWLNSKSVIVQKFAGEKPLNWGKLGKVWELLGDKAGFMDYVTAETCKLLDAG